ncbi:hypothetical protein [Microbacterium atlanticum]|uniref:MmyB family transcriptional regulator n=1 Tax=Microbacterium atlanticum TaxID=2782168 RepID=UPI0018880AC4
MDHRSEVRGFLSTRRTGVKKLRHPVVGDVELTYEAFELPADPGLTLSTYTAEPGSPSADALRMLAIWAAIDEHPTAGEATLAQRTVERRSSWDATGREA